MDKYLEWVQDVDMLIQSLKGEVNDRELRGSVTKNIMITLEKYGVRAYVDCGPKINTPEVVNHGEFHAFVDAGDVSVLFKFRNNKEKWSK